MAGLSGLGDGAERALGEVLLDKECLAPVAISGACHDHKCTGSGAEVHSQLTVLHSDKRRSAAGSGSALHV